MSLKKRFVLSIIGVFLLIMLVGTATYAWFKWRSTAQENVNVNLTVTSVITFIGGPDINGYLDPAYSYLGGTRKDVKITSELPGSTFNLYMKINKLPDELKEDFFLWAIYKGNEYIEGGNFDNSNAGDNVTLLLDREIPVDTYDTYSLYLWLDAEEDYDSSIANKIVDFSLYATGNNGAVNEVS